MAEAARPVALRKDGDDRLLIDWSDGHHGVCTWKSLREHCPCAGCREDHEKPPDPFRILKPSELLPLKPVNIAPVGHYAYKITWSDCHDTGLFTLEHLRQLCECELCKKK